MEEPRGLWGNRIIRAQRRFAGAKNGIRSISLPQPRPGLSLVRASAGVQKYPEFRLRFLHRQCHAFVDDMGMLLPPDRGLHLSKSDNTKSTYVAYRHA